jgi:hypothetical protein
VSLASDGASPGPQVVASEPEPSTR